VVVKEAVGSVQRVARSSAIAARKRPAPNTAWLTRLRRQFLERRRRLRRGEAGAHRRLHHEQRHDDGGQAGGQRGSGRGRAQPGDALHGDQQARERDPDGVVDQPAEPEFVGDGFGLRDRRVGDAPARQVPDPATDGREARGRQAQALRHPQPAVEHGGGAEADEGDLEQFGRCGHGGLLASLR
jgi:hypothetical protein